MIPVILTKTLAAASATAVCASQSLASAGNLVINGSSASGGVATLDTGRQVVIASAGNDSGITFTVYGTQPGGNVTQQTLTGANAGSVATSFSFATITQIAVSGATASTVTVGTNTTGSTHWKNPNWHLTPFLIGITTFVTGTVTYNIETTNDDYLTPKTPTTIVGVTQTATTGATAAVSTSLTQPVRGWRLTITSGTGTVTAEAIQAGIVNY